MTNAHGEDPARPRYYITTAIDYPNAPPHIGHSLEKVAADVVARYHRLQGHDTYFSGGLDENSQHVVKAASAHDVDLVTWTKRMDAAFRLAWSKLDVSYDYWIRTSQAHHVLAAQEVLEHHLGICPAKQSIYRTERALATGPPSRTSGSVEYGPLCSGGGHAPAGAFPVAVYALGQQPHPGATGITTC